MAKDLNLFKLTLFQGVFVVMFALLLLSFIAFLCEIVFAGYLDKRHAKNLVSNFKVLKHFSYSKIIRL